MITVWLRGHRRDDKQDAVAPGMAAQSQVISALMGSPTSPLLSRSSNRALSIPRIKHFYLMRGENPVFYPLHVPRAQRELKYKHPQTHGREE